MLVILQATHTFQMINKWKCWSIPPGHANYAQVHIRLAKKREGGNGRPPKRARKNPHTSISIKHHGTALAVKVQKGNREDEPKSVRLDRSCGMGEARRPLSAQDVRKRRERLRSASHDPANERRRAELSGEGKQASLISWRPGARARATTKGRGLTP